YTLTYQIFLIGREELRNMPTDDKTPQLPDLYTLDSIEQMRAVADELRIRIMDLLIQRPLTVTMVGDALGIAPAKAHYHVRELERVGLVKLVATRERGGILEKYYRAVAQNFTVSDTLLRRTTSNEARSAIGAHLQTLNRAFLRALSRAIGSGEPHAHFIQLTTASLWTTRDEMHALSRRITELLEPYYSPRSGVDVQPRMLAIVGYDVAQGDEVDGQRETELTAKATTDRATVSSPAVPTARSSSPGSTTTRRVVVAGAVSYTRDDLELVVARGEVLDMHIIGIGSFASGIPAELVDRAITRFRLRGVLSASP